MEISQICLVEVDHEKASRIAFDFVVGISGEGAKPSACASEATPKDPHAKREWAA
jgi:hypothetical protein